MTNVPIQTVFANTRAGTATFVQADGSIATQTALNTRSKHFINGVPGALFEKSRITRVLHRRDLANAAWSKTNMTTARTSVGADGATSSATRITATASNATVLQSITHTSTARAMTAYIKRVTGSGTIQMTMDNGTTWTAVTATTAYTRVTIPTQTLANPVVGFRIVTSGDAIDVDFVQLEDGAFPTSVIDGAAGTAVTRLSDSASVSLSDIVFDAGGGSIFIEGRAYYATGGSNFPRVFQIDDGTAGNRLFLQIVESSSLLRLLISKDGEFTAVESLSYTSGDYFKVGIRYEDDNCVLSLNGSDSTADTDVTLPTGLTTLRWQTDSAGGGDEAAVHITKFATYAHEFADATLNAETA